jgi:hypothetical protein
MPNILLTFFIVHVHGSSAFLGIRSPMDISRVIAEATVLELL